MCLRSRKCGSVWYFNGNTTSFLSLFLLLVLGRNNQDLCRRKVPNEFKKRRQREVYRVILEAAFKFIKEYFYSQGSGDASN